jgi:pimeloyl-ACP methyl ester carboxylesterase
MLKDGLGARIFIRASILALRSVAPLSLLYCVFRLGVPLERPLPQAFRILDIYAGAESAFLLLVYFPRRLWLNRPAPAYNPLPSSKNRQVAFSRTWECTPDPYAYVSLWFLGAPIEVLCREDVKDWLYWRLWNSTKRALADEPELDDYLSQTEQILSFKFPDGRSSNKSMAVTFEPVRMMHRPLIWYFLFVGAADFQMCCTLPFYGFRFYSLPLFSRTRLYSPLPIRPLSLLSPYRSPSQRLSYWSLPHTSKNHLPILFIHAIGVGLQFYLPFFKELYALHKRTGIGIIAIEILPTSSRISAPILSPTQMAQEIQLILQYHNISLVTLMSHSYGSVISTHLLRSPLTSPLIGPLLFVDPVAFGFHDPNIAYNFLRRIPKSASEIQLQYFASVDPDIAYTLTRRFIWPENSLWREDVEDHLDQDSRWKCTVMLGGQDIITDTETLGKYLTREKGMKKWYEEHDDRRMTDEWKREDSSGEKGLEVIWFEGLNHSEIFDDQESREAVLKVVEKYARDGVRVGVEAESSANGTVDNFVVGRRV